MFCVYEARWRLNASVRRKVSAALPSNLDLDTGPVQILSYENEHQTFQTFADAALTRILGVLIFEETSITRYGSPGHGARVDMSFPAMVELARHLRES
jgi:hypothetical protein